MNQNLNPYPEIILRHFQESDREQFLAMVDDEEIKENFDEFKIEKEIIGYKFGGLNDEIPLSQYWGIFLHDGTLVGFVALKKSPSIRQTLERLRQDPKAEPEFDFTLETAEQIKQREWREKIKSPYALDVVVHKDHRRKKIAQRAISEIYQYAASAGLKEIYLEVRESNNASKSMISGLNPQKIASASEHHGHELYRIEVKTKTPTSQELMEAITKAPSEDKLVLTTWRHMVIAFPDLAPHRDLVLALLNAIVATDAHLVTTDECKGCRHVNEYDKTKIIVCLAKRDKPLTLIWSLAHELGHLQQTEAKGAERKDFTLEKFMREEGAWKKGEKWLNDKPLFIYNWEDFFQFRHERLQSYFPSKA